jgi:CRP-like cAMP-binding protein
MPDTDYTLGSLGVFAQLSADELESIQALIQHQKVVEAQILVQKGDPATTFFIVLSGNFMIAFDKGRAITLHHKGDIMGWSTVFTPFRYKGTIVALTDGEILTLPGEDFLRLILNNAALGDKVMKKINQIAAERMSFVKEG